MKAFLLLAGAVMLSHAALAQDHQHGGNDSAQPLESGQSAFGAITEVVTILEADAGTDWSRVNVDALRDHLVDMDNVTVRARVTTTAVPGGARFLVEGDGAVRESIRRTARSHARTINRQAGRKTMVEDSPEGAVMTVTASDPAEAQRIRALGFFGVMTSGAHHQRHHLLMARGKMAH